MNIEHLDLTVIDPIQRQHVVKKKINELEPGDELVICNDHNPRGLQHWLQEEKGSTYRWVYLESGPEKWQVQITRLSGREAESGIQQWFSRDLRSAAVLHAMEIDFLVPEGRGFGSGQETVSFESDEMLTGLNTFQNILPLFPFEFGKWPIDFLMDYLLRIHHAYFLESVPIIAETGRKVASVHGTEHPELKKMLEWVERLAGDVSTLLKLEREQLFPDSRLHLGKSGVVSEADLSQSWSRNRDEWVVAWDRIGEALRESRKLTDWYKPPVEACITYRFLFKILKETDFYLCLHFYLVNGLIVAKGKVSIDKA